MTSTPPRRPSVKQRLRRTRGKEGEPSEAPARRAARTGPAGGEAPGVADDETWHEDDYEAGDDERTRLNDPFFGFLVALAVSLGLTQIDTETRYIVLWTLLLLMGGAFYLFSNREFVADVAPSSLAGGVGFGLLIGLPALALVAPALAAASRQLFPEMSDASVYLALVFAIPIGETLFFRGAIQETRGFRVAALAAGAWSVFLFVPNRLPAEAVVIGVTVVGLAFAYTYVRQRYGLVAAWMCQVVVNVCLLFLSRLG